MKFSSLSEMLHHFRALDEHTDYRFLLKQDFDMVLVNSANRAAELMWKYLIQGNVCNIPNDSVLQYAVEKTKKVLAEELEFATRSPIFALETTT